MIISACMTCTGQFMWKIAGSVALNQHVLFLTLGLIMYGVGALLMVAGFKYGEMSTLHPLLSIGYVGALFLGYYFLDEDITLKRAIGIVCILIGVFFVTRTEGNE